MTTPPKSLIDNPQSLAERVKRLRELDAVNPGADDIVIPLWYAMQTINDLVNLVGVMHDGLNKFWLDEWYPGNEDCSDLMRKSAPIAALAKEKL